MSRFEHQLEKEWSNSNEIDFARHTVTDTEKNIEYTVVDSCSDSKYTCYPWSAPESKGDWGRLPCRVEKLLGVSTDAIHEKMVVSVPDFVKGPHTDSLRGENYIVTVWADNTEDEFEEGDLLVLSSVVVDEYQDNEYLSYNSASEHHFVDEEYVKMLGKELRNIVADNTPHVRND